MRQSAAGGNIKGESESQTAAARAVCESCCDNTYRASSLTWVQKAAPGAVGPWLLLLLHVPQTPQANESSSASVHENQRSTQAGLRWPW